MASRYAHEAFGELAPTGLGCIAYWSSDLARQWSEHLVEAAQAHSEIVTVVAIGSAARGAKYAADVDFLLIYRGESPELNTPPIDVDLRSFPVDRVPELVKQGNELLGWAVVYGSTVLDRDGWWQNLCVELRPMVPLPSADEARKRASRARGHFEYLEQVGDHDAAAEQKVTELTHTARAKLIGAGVYPASRPELPAQLNSIGETKLASALDRVLKSRELGAGASRFPRS